MCCKQIWKLDYHRTVDVRQYSEKGGEQACVESRTVDIRKDVVAGQTATLQNFIFVTIHIIQWNVCT